jgi:ATPase family associated with various cellular activities (AAA)
VSLAPAELATGLAPAEGGRGSVGPGGFAGASEGGRPEPGSLPTVQGPAWLEEVRLRASRRVMWLRQLWSSYHYEGEHLLPISHSDVDRALLPPAELRAAESSFYLNDERAAALSRDLGTLTEMPPDPSWEQLRVGFDLQPPELHLLALCLAGAADPAMRRVFGYLLDSPEPMGPTPALTVALFGDSPFWCPSPNSALVRWLLARPLDDGRDPYSSSTNWDADALLLPPLLGQTTGDPAADGSVTDWSAGAIGVEVGTPVGCPLRPDVLDEIVRFVRSLSGAEAPTSIPIEIEIVGPPGSGRTSLAARSVACIGPPFRTLASADAEAITQRPDPTAAVVREIRRARLEGRALIWEHAEAIPASSWPALALAPLTFLSTTSELTAPADFGSVRRSFRLEPISRRERAQLWSSFTSSPIPSPVSDWDLRPAEIAVAARVTPAGELAVREVCRRLLLAGTPELLTPLPLPHGWGDLVISPRTERHLRELDSQARNRAEVLDEWGFARLTSMGRGVTALFAGPSGTGKTMAAQVLARSLGLELCRVDLAGLVSKYIGETEKHLRVVFDTCERAPILLLFDEADALFGKRTEVNDAHDRYANIEVDYVLQRMESFNGVAVLATNRKGDLDSAFVRRIQFIIDFSPPTPPERERLWRLALDHAATPDGEYVIGPLDWGKLGAQFDLTGAGIKSAALAAAFLARDDGGSIEMSHVLAATRRELEKQGKVMRGQEGPQ